MVESAVAGTFFCRFISPATKVVDECWEVVGGGDDGGCSSEIIREGKK
jgi:hypothetical protein